MRVWRLGFSMLVRDWRAGELRVLVAAAALAVALAGGMMLLVERLESGITAQGNRLLGADRLLRSDRPAPDAWLRRAEALGLRRASSVQLPSMLFSAEQTQLAVVRGVSDAWPLRGEVRLRRTPDGAVSTQRATPDAGEVWMEPRLLSLLDVGIGDVVELGDITLRVGAVLVAEPDRGTGLFSYGPRALLRHQDLLRAGLLSEGARVRYDELFAGSPSALSAFGRWLESEWGEERRYRWLGLETARPSIARLLDRAGGYLGLCGGIAVLLSGLAVSMAARRYADRQRRAVAMMKVFGAPFGAIAVLYVEAVALVWLLATALGCALAWGLHAGLFWALGELLQFEPGPAGWRPWLYSAAVSMACLGAFALPPLLALRRTPPLLALRDDVPFAAGHGPGTALGVAALGLLAYGYLEHGAAASALLLAAVAVFAGLGAVALVLLLVGQGAGAQAGGLWRLAFGNLRRERARTVLLVGLFGLLLGLAFLTWLLRTAMLDDWRDSLPPKTPNHFVMNVAPAQLEPLRDSLSRAGIAIERLAPMVSARLLRIDGQAVPEAVADGVDRRALRDFSLSWSAELPAGNALVAGSWWSGDTETAAISVERELAERLGVAPGDALAFQVADRTVEAVVANIRRVDWREMRPNFMLVLSPGAARELSPSWIGVFYVPPSSDGALSEISRRFRTVTMLALAPALAEMRRALDQLGDAVGMSLAAAMTVAALALGIAVHSSMDERLVASSLLRALGASRMRLMGALAAEFASIGLVAGALGTLAAEFAMRVLAVQMLDSEASWHPWLWLVGPLCGAALVAAFGLLSAWRVVRASPLALLRAET